MNKVVLLLGSNIGQRIINLANAVLEINEQLGKIIASSSIYETAPWGNEDQESFLNQVIILTSALSHEKMMKRILLIEEKLGRIRTKKWEPRIIDIDILFFNDEIISSENLIIPHPGLHERKFTLVPLAELIPDYLHPVLKKTIAEILNGLKDPLEVKKISNLIA